MGYFTYTRSEEELKEQYRRLLIKYNYKDERNRKVIEAITKEYEETLKQVKYDNGYRTFGQKIKEKAEAALDEMNRAHEAEVRRKSALQNRAWTQQDLLSLVTRIKGVMQRTIPMLFESGNDYVVKQMKMALYDSKRKKEIYDACTQFIAVVSEADAKELNLLKEALEYCVFYLVGKDEEKEEVVLRNLEDKMGTWAEELCKPYMDEDVDPIEDLKIRNEAKLWSGREEASEKEWKFASAGFSFLMSLPGFGVILIWLAFASDMMATEPEALLDAENYFPLPFAALWLWMCYMVYKGNKARIERRKRIVGKEKNVKIHNQTSIMRFILRLFGF